MKRISKIITYILITLIMVYITSFFTKNRKNNEISKQETKQEINYEETKPGAAEENKTSMADNSVSLEEEKVAEKEISNEKEVVKEEKVEEDKIENKRVENERYINTVVKTYYDENKKDYAYTLKKGTRVFVLESLEIEKTVKNKNTQNEEVITIKNSKISFKDLDEEKVVWVEDKFLTDNRAEVLSGNLDDIKIVNKEKREYEGNPRVKVRGLYVSAKTLAWTKRLDEILKLAKENNINAFVIDVKGDYGEITFPVSEEVKDYSESSNKNVDIKEIEPIMQKLKENNIYTIARIVSFKDPIYAKENPKKVITYKENGKAFSNKDGLTWVSPHDRKLWEYNIFVAKEAAKAGFNEIQFDYVRFPASDGGKLDKVLDYKNTKTESKAKTIQEYLDYARQELEPLNVYISADVYGQVASVEDDMALGQYWEAVSSEVDYISPMMYPSHYGKGVYGLSVPDANPYKTVYNSTKDSINRNNNIENPAVIRPWIQAFTAKWVKGHIKYGPQEIREQIKAMKDLGVEEYILWSPTNKYEAYF